jgi:hypothetical protein
MKTLKISVVATVAMMLAWWLRLPHKFWPSHPYLADTVMAVVLCLVLQAVWTDPKIKSKKEIS